MTTHIPTGEMLVLAREYRGLSQAEFADRIGVSRSALCKFELNLRPINAELLDVACAKLHLPASFFTRPNDKVLPNLHWRKKTKTSAKHIRTAEAEMNVHRLGLQQLLTSIELNTKPLPSLLLEEHGTPVVVAQKLRQLWGISKGPILKLFETIEKHGVFIIYCDFHSTDISGRSMPTKDKQSIIYLNRSDVMDRQRFTLAHELGHLIMHVSGSMPAEQRDTEQEANDFASEFLVPSRELGDQIGGKLDLGKLADLKLYWKVSMAALLMRARRSGIISPTRYKTLQIELSSRGYRMQEPANLEPPREVPQLFKRLVQMHQEELDLDEQELESVVGLPFSEIQSKYLDSAVRKLRLLL